MEKLSLKSIRLDGGTQMRVGPRNQEAVREYADILQDGGQLPPVTVFYDGRDYWLSDGFHRYSAHMLLDWKEIEAEVHEGSKREAILYAVGANASHGLRRSNKDKRQAVETLLKDTEWGKWTDAEISRRAAVSPMTVGRIRQELISNNVIDRPTERTVQRGGTTYTQNTANIGQRSGELEAQENNAETPKNDKLSHLDVPSDSPAPPYSQPTEPTAHAAPAYAQAAEAEPEGKVIKPYMPFVDDEPPPAKTEAEIEKGVKEIHSALEKLLRHERDGRGLLAIPDPFIYSVRDLARHTREMLDEWLDEASEIESRTITLEALN